MTDQLMDYLNRHLQNQEVGAIAIINDAYDLITEHYGITQAPVDAELIENGSEMLVTWYLEDGRTIQFNAKVSK